MANYDFKQVWADLEKQRLGSPESSGPGNQPYFEKPPIFGSGNNTSAFGAYASSSPAFTRNMLNPISFATGEPFGGATRKAFPSAQKPHSSTKLTGTSQDDEPLSAKPAPNASPRAKGSNCPPNAPVYPWTFPPQIPPWISKEPMQTAHCQAPAYQQPADAGVHRLAPVNAATPGFGFRPPVFGIPAAPADRPIPTTRKAPPSQASVECVMTTCSNERDQLCNLNNELAMLRQEDHSVSRTLLKDAVLFVEHLDKILHYLGELSKVSSIDQDVIDFGREILQDIRRMHERVRAVVYPSGTAISRRCEQWREQMLRCAKSFELETEKRGKIAKGGDDGAAEMPATPTTKDQLGSMDEKALSSHQSHEETVQSTDGAEIIGEKNDSLTPRQGRKDSSVEDAPAQTSDGASNPSTTLDKGWETIDPSC